METASLVFIAFTAPAFFGFVFYSSVFGCVFRQSKDKSLLVVSLAFRKKNIARARSCIPGILQNLLGCSASFESAQKAELACNVPGSIWL